MVLQKAPNIAQHATEKNILYSETHTEIFLLSNIGQIRYLLDMGRFPEWVIKICLMPQELTSANIPPFVVFSLHVVLHVVSHVEGVNLFAYALQFLWSHFIPVAFQILN